MRRAPPSLHERVAPSRAPPRWHGCVHPRPIYQRGRELEPQLLEIPSLLPASALRRRELVPLDGLEVDDQGVDEVAMNGLLSEHLHRGVEIRRQRALEIPADLLLLSRFGVGLVETSADLDLDVAKTGAVTGRILEP